MALPQRQLEAAVAALCADRRIDGVLVQPMVVRPKARELIAGIADDPVFGPVVVFGRGGTAVEVIDDKTLALPPLDLRLAHELIGHDVGGVCPFALPEDVKVYLDVSMKRFETVFPAAGSSNSAIEMTCEELERYSSNFSGWVDVCKPKEG